MYAETCTLLTMDRVRRQYQAEAIGFALSLVPESVRELRPHFFTGNPLFSGLHAYGEMYGQSYADMAHVAYAHNQVGCIARDRRHTTVVLPEIDYCYWPRTIVHEVGHVLHEKFEWRDFGLSQTSWYAAADPLECFAEAFTAYVLPRDQDFRADFERLTRKDHEILRFLTASEPKSLVFERF